MYCCERLAIDIFVDEIRFCDKVAFLGLKWIRKGLEGIGAWSKVID